MLSLLRAGLLAFPLLAGTAIGQDPQPLEADLRSRLREGVALEDVRVLRQGRWLRPRDESDLVATGMPMFALRDRSAYVETSGNGAQVVEFPFRLLQFDDSTGHVKEFRPVILLPPGLAFDPEAKDYRGTALLGLIDLESPGAQTGLVVAFQVYLHTDRGSADRELVLLERAGLPYREVPIRLTDPADRVRLFVYTDVFGQAPPLKVPVLRPHLELHVSPARIAGFGLGTSRLTVLAEGASQRGVHHVSLTADHGVLQQPELLPLDTEGFGSGGVRSSGLGTALLKVSHQHYRAARAEVHYVFPWTFLYAALLGGWLGAVLRMRRLRALVTRALGLGLVAGMAVLLVSSAAILLFQLELEPGFREAAVFLLAMLTGFGCTRSSPA